jgi:thiol-disulfide isomerase/thioredoxin
MVNYLYRSTRKTIAMISTRILYLFLLLFLNLTTLAQKNVNDKTITIIGRVKGDTNGYNQIYYYKNDVKVDSVTIKDGQFKITLPYNGLITWALYTQYERKTTKSYRPFPLVIDQPGIITVDMNMEQGFFGSKIYGAKTTALLADFYTRRDELYRRVRALDPKLKDSVRKAGLADLCLDFVKNNPTEFASAYVLRTSGKSAMSLAQLEKGFSYLSPKLKKSEEGERTAAFINGLKSLRIGKTVKNFVLNNPEGKPVDFAQFKGKYVWIDFWASWCVPCKKAFPYMRELYEKYKGEEFEILGISTDATKESWLKILDQIKNPWPQVWDAKNIAAEFTVTAFPTSFLIDPEGKVIVKEVGFEPQGAIERKLGEIFGK